MIVNHRKVCNRLFICYKIPRDVQKSLLTTASLFKKSLFCEHFYRADAVERCLSDCQSVKMQYCVETVACWNPFSV